MKNKIIQLLLLICCLPALTGCIREEEYANDPIGNFEQLWKIIDEQYCFLDTKGIDWDAVHDEYSKLLYKPEFPGTFVTILFLLFPDPCVELKKKPADIRHWPRVGLPLGFLR